MALFSYDLQRTGELEERQCIKRKTIRYRSSKLALAYVRFTLTNVFFQGSKTDPALREVAREI